MKERIRFESELASLGLAQQDAHIMNRESADSTIIGGRYGGYNLNLGDQDRGFKYGGVKRTRANWDSLPPEGTLPFVEKLQVDLSDLGFKLVKHDPKGIFDRYTKWAVREFQIYANMKNVARLTGTDERYANQLSRVRNTNWRQGPKVTGVLNRATRYALQHWLDNQYRCPVVIDALDKDSNKNFTVVKKENIWLRDDLPSTSPRMYARDFTEYYNSAQPPQRSAFPPNRNPDDFIIVGDWYKLNSTHSGPRSDYLHVFNWSEAEITHESMIGKPHSQLTAEERSSFKVIRAVSNWENGGFFDAINAWDDVFISVGPFHQPIGFADDLSGGELCAVLSEFREIDPVAFEQAFGFFGIRATRAWNGNGRNLFNTQRRYATTLTLQEEDITKGENDPDRVYYPNKPMSLKHADMNYLRSWHWFYRFLMATRTIEGFRRAFWRTSRLRTRELLRTPLGPEAPGVRIGDVFTSEKGVALILRWHVRAPGNMALNGTAGRWLINSYRLARIQNRGPSAWGTPNTWTDQHELALIESLMNRVPEMIAAEGRSGMRESMRAIRGYQWLSESRGSYPFRDLLNDGISGLSPVPDP
jgi:hypothetical protein